LKPYLKDSFEIFDYFIPKIHWSVDFNFQRFIHVQVPIQVPIDTDCFGRFSIDAAKEMIGKCFFLKDVSRNLKLRNAIYRLNNECLGYGRFIRTMKRPQLAQAHWVLHSKRLLLPEVVF
jgi:hypothetical protein